MIKIYCDRCGKEINTQTYYRINFICQNIYEPISTGEVYDRNSKSKPFSLFSSPSNPYPTPPNSDSIINYIGYCDKCIEEIMKFVNTHPKMI